MKKSDIALILGAILVIIISIFAFSGSEKITTPVTLSDDFAEVKTIAYDDYKTMLDEEKTFIIVIEREGCSHCERFNPVIEEVATEKATPIYRVDISTFTDEEMTKFSESNRFLKSTEWGTPTTLVLKGKTVVDSLPGYREKEEFISFLDKTVKVNSKSEETE